MKHVEPLELVARARPDRVLAFACGTCGCVVPTTLLPTGEADPADRKRAAEHCASECACGAKVARGRDLCAACAERQAAHRDERLYARAIKLPIEEYPDDPLYWRGHRGKLGYGFFANLEDLLDRCDHERIDPPDYVWACKRQVVQVDAGLFTAPLVDLGIELSSGALQRLQDRLDAWAKEEGETTWRPDFSRAVVLTPEPFASTIPPPHVSGDK